LATVVCRLREENRRFAVTFPRLGVTPLGPWYADPMHPAAPTIARKDHHRIVSATVAPCPLGFLGIVIGDRGVRWISLGDCEQTVRCDLERDFPAAADRDHNMANRWAVQIVAYVEHPIQPFKRPLDPAGTAFQQRVWQALRQIPLGTTTTYSGLADRLGQPRAARAVARACAANPIAVLIPCHRVIRRDGGLGGYRWGIELKGKLLARESALVGRSDPMTFRPASCGADAGRC
jgi:AraC family transcriptional regulator of adaptative response/methylated-DNA-[protein]-cysteine methyltransferase